MAEGSISKGSERALKAVSPLLQFFGQSRWAKRYGSPGICDFTIGNPHELPAQAFVDALSRSVIPQDCHWFAYKMNEEGARRTVADSLLQWRGVSFDSEDIFLTNGATGALAVVMHTILDPGDEVIYLSPSWFLYEAMIINCGAVPVRVNAAAPAFDLDVSAIQDAMTEKTRAVIVNSPHNPTGRVYSGETLRRLGEVLDSASSKSGRPVYLISDEAYARVIFDGKGYPSPSSFYDRTFLVYTYGKTLLTPGQRIGYIALPPTMPDRPRLRQAIPSQQMLNSWAFPNALMQHALSDLEQIGFDIEGLQRKRDRVVKALREIGYETTVPEGTFYCLVRSPLPDDRAFVELLADRDLYCIPGSLQGASGYFRVSLTASDEMIKRALPLFAEVLQEARPIRG